MQKKKGNQRQEKQERLDLAWSLYALQRGGDEARGKVGARMLSCPPAYLPLPRFLWASISSSRCFRVQSHPDGCLEWSKLDHVLPAAIQPLFTDEIKFIWASDKSCEKLQQDSLGVCVER